MFCPEGSLSQVLLSTTGTTTQGFWRHEGWNSYLNFRFGQPMHTSTSKHGKSIRKPGVLRAEMMEESESGQKPGESGVRKGNPG